MGLVTTCLSLFLLFVVPPVLAQEWAQLDATGPSARRTAAAILDPVGDRILLFGGRGSSGDLGDVWAFDLEQDTWRQIAIEGDGPTPRFSHNAVYDPPGHRMLVWSGRSVDASGSTLLNDVWALDLETSRWTELTPTNQAPVERYGTAAVFDPVAGSLVTFAGFTTQGRFDDTWRFDPVARTWRDVTAASPQPGERCLHAAAYDPRQRRMIMFGGQRGSDALHDAWALDLTTDRKFPAVSYDSVGDRFFVFGGEQTDGTRSGDLWALDMRTETWSTQTTTGPPPRDGAVLVFVPVQSRLVLFGGTTPEGGHVADTWTLPIKGPPTAVTGHESAVPVTPTMTAYPNPCNASVTLDLSVTEHGRLQIYDTLGRSVRQLGLVAAGPGQRFWDGRDDAGREVASGVYLAVLQSPSSRRVTRLALLR